MSNEKKKVILKKALISYKYKYREWEFMPVFVPHPGEHGIPENLEQVAGDVTIESICGGIDDSQPVEQYDGTLGVTTNFVNDHQSPVGQLQWNDNLGAIYNNPGNVSGVRWGSGTLISCDLFLTAGHCFDQTGGGWTRPRINGTSSIIPPAEIATNMHVNFNYQVDQNGNLRQQQEFPVIQLEEYRLNGLDYAIIRLGGNPGGPFGLTRLSPNDANINDMLCVIGHPAGLPKRIEAGPCSDIVGNQIRYNSIDTLGGNSGSGILNPNGEIVGVHTNGGCNQPAIGHNHGVRIGAIIPASPIISNLLSTKHKFFDDGCIVKFKVADDVKLKVVDDVKLKVVDDVKLKITDDVKLKITDDGKLKILDDGKLKTLDDGKLKAIDDVKTAGYDKYAFFDGGPWQGPYSGQRLTDRGYLIRSIRSGRSPFILSTPHHYKSPQDRITTDRSFPQNIEDIISDYEILMSEIDLEIKKGNKEIEYLEKIYDNISKEHKKLVDSQKEMK